MNIIIGVTSGIACYKIIDLIRKLRKNFNINVIMTKNSLNLISKKEFEKVANKVAVELFNKNFNYKYYLKNNKKIKHISLADKADLVVIAPATANIIGKIANGIADDLLSTTVLATKAPVLICPSMNVNMWKNKIVQENVKKLKNLGYYFVKPEYGMLACGYKGVGRLADLDKITEKIRLLTKKKDLKNKNIIITAGPTQESIDPVRVITNKSSGKMGYALAEAASLRGANVTLISGPTSLEAPSGVNFIEIETAEEMRKAVLRHYNKAGIVIMAAAVADFKAKSSKDKIKLWNSKNSKGLENSKNFQNKQKNLVLKLTKNVDILEELGKKKREQILVGFALETKDLIKNALTKLKNKNLDIIVANKADSLGKESSDFVLINKKYKRKFLNIAKVLMAEKILDAINELK